MSARSTFPALRRRSAARVLLVGLLWALLPAAPVAKAASAPAPIARVVAPVAVERPGVVRRAAPAVAAARFEVQARRPVRRAAPRSWPRVRHRLWLWSRALLR